MALRRSAGWVLVALVVLSFGARAAEFNLGVTVGDIKLGKHVVGPEVSADELKHRVVLLEFWGVNCGPCLAAMPKLAGIKVS